MSTEHQTKCQTRPRNDSATLLYLLIMASGLAILGLRIFERMNEQRKKEARAIESAHEKKLVKKEKTTQSKEWSNRSIESVADGMHSTARKVNLYQENREIRSRSPSNMMDEAVPALKSVRNRAPTGKPPAIEQEYQNRAPPVKRTKSGNHNVLFKEPMDDVTPHYQANEVQRSTRAAKESTRAPVASTHSMHIEASEMKFARPVPKPASKWSMLTSALHQAYVHMTVPVVNEEVLSSAPLPMRATMKVVDVLNDTSVAVVADPIAFGLYSVSYAAGTAVNVAKKTTRWVPFVSRRS